MSNGVPDKRGSTGYEISYNVWNAACRDLERAAVYLSDAAQKMRKAAVKPKPDKSKKKTNQP
jgi:hypothetical protein